MCAGLQEEGQARCSDIDGCTHAEKPRGGAHSPTEEAGRALTGEVVDATTCRHLLKHACSACDACTIAPGLHTDWLCPCAVNRSITAAAGAQVTSCKGSSGKLMLHVTA